MNAQRLRVRYFASIREALGFDEEAWLSQANTLNGLREELQQRGDPWASALATHVPMRMALNRVLASGDAPLVGADESQADAIEVAFFPPVTGG